MSYDHNPSITISVMVDADTPLEVAGHTNPKSDGKILALRMDGVTVQSTPDGLVAWLETALKAACAERARVWPADLSDPEPVEVA